jgi:ATP-binding cassette subfamily B protein
MGRNSAKEVRAFNLAGFLRQRYDRLYDERIAELRQLAKRRTGRSLLGSLASSGVTVATIAMLAWLYISDRMSLAVAGAAVFGLALPERPPEEEESPIEQIFFGGP